MIENLNRRMPGVWLSDDVIGQIKTIKPIGLAVYCVLCDSSQEERISLEEIRKLVGCSAASLDKAIEKLIQVGFLARKGRSVEILDHSPASPTFDVRLRLPERRPTHIYLIRDEKTGLVKIGRSKNPESRFATLMADEPALTLLHFSPADLSVERDLHRAYADRRRRGEWFELTADDIMKIISSLSV
ncbi:MAG TPA: GIY-YIG nuclease family protein [Acidobacteriaceae bacterium]